MVLLLSACGSGSSTTSHTARPTSSPAGGGNETVALTVPDSMRGGELSEPHRLTVPKGWKASVWARPEGARMLAITPEGNLLVSTPTTGAVTELSGGAEAEGEKVVVAGLESAQGLTFGKRGGQWVLYVGESDEIDAFPWLGGGKVGARKVLAPNLPDEEPAGDDIHRQKDVVVGLGRAGRIYFDVGRMRWDAKRRTLEPAKTLVSGFQDKDGERWGRPVDVVPGPEGALFVSDDTAGAIYKLRPPGA